MLCTILEREIDCFFATKEENGKNSCSYNNSGCVPIVDECLKGDDDKACENIVDMPNGKYCTKFPNPESRWERGHCPLATHVKVDFSTPIEKKLNPLKASKRAAKGG